MYVIQASQLTKLAIILAIGFAITLLAINITSGDMESEGSEKLQANESGTAEEVTPEAPRDQRPRTGGLGKAYDQPTREKNSEVFEIIEKIKPDFERKTNTKYDSVEVLSYKHQVVAGMNFFVKAQTKTVDGKQGVAHLRVYKDLKGGVELTSFQLDKTREDEIIFF